MSKQTAKLFIFWNAPYYAFVTKWAWNSIENYNFTQKKRRIIKNKQLCLVSKIEHKNLNVKNQIVNITININHSIIITEYYYRLLNKPNGVWGIHYHFISIINYHNFFLLNHFTFGIQRWPNANTCDTAKNHEKNPTNWKILQFHFFSMNYNYNN